MIFKKIVSGDPIKVSLFTREWIEIIRVCASWTAKCLSLPLYEGVDWNKTSQKAVWFWNQSPSLRGSGLKYHCWNTCKLVFMSPSLRGSGLKWCSPHGLHGCFTVSLFTREWIEIQPQGDIIIPISSLPLYEGVDWNVGMRKKTVTAHGSPSLRGSGLKLSQHDRYRRTAWGSPSLRGSGLKFWCYPLSIQIFSSPSLRGSGLKLIDRSQLAKKLKVSLFTREWIEISWKVK